MATLEGVVSSRDQVMAGNLGNVEAGLVVKLPIVKGPVFGFQPVKERKFLFHLMDGLKDQQVTGG